MQISQDTLIALEAAEIDGLNVRLKGQLDRKLYERVNKVLEAAGGKWNRKAKAHVFSEDPASVIERAILTGAITVPQDFGFFETSVDLAERVVSLAGIEKSHSVLEPSAGTGRIARVAAKITPDVDCVELLPANARKLLAGQFARKLTIGDFLSIPASREYDRIVMNPPFEKQSDIRHVLHALDFLRPGGRLVSIMAAGVRFRDNRLTRDFRDRVVSCGGWFEDLPEGSFKESGTMVNTTLVVMPG